MDAVAGSIRWPLRNSKIDSDSIGLASISKLDRRTRRVAPHAKFRRIVFRETTCSVGSSSDRLQTWDCNVENPHEFSKSAKLAE